MAFTVTARHSGNTGQVQPETITSDSTTPSANSLLVVASCTQNNAHQTATSWSFSGGGWTYTTRATRGPHAFNAQTEYSQSSALATAPVGGSPSAHTIVVDPYAGAQQGAQNVVACDVTGHNVSSPVVQTAVNGQSETTIDNAVGTVTLGSTPATGNLVIVAFAAGADSSGGFAVPTAGAGKTLTSLFNQNDSWTQGSLWYRVWDGSESTTITCSDMGQAVGSWTAIAIEIASDSTTQYQGSRSQRRTMPARSWRRPRPTTTWSITAGGTASMSGMRDMLLPVSQTAKQAWRSQQARAVYVRPVHPKASTVTDAFDTKNTNRWNYDDWPTEVTHTGSAASISCTVSYYYLQAIENGAIDNPAPLDLTESEVYAEAIQVPSLGNGTRSARMEFLPRGTTSSNDWIRTIVEGSTIYFQWSLNGSTTTVSSETYSSTNHRWWKISESGGTVTWWTSTNGSSWTSKATAAAPFDLDSVELRFTCGYSGSETSPEPFLVDNVNSAPVGLSQTLTDSAGITDSLAVALTIGRTIDDSLGIADSVATQATYDRSFTDAFGPTDSITTQATLTRSITDPLGITDSVTAAYSRDITDPLGVTDSITTQATFSRDIADSLGLTDAITTAATFSRTLDDSIGVTDTVSAAVTISRVIDDSMGVVDDASSAKFIDRTISDQMGVADSIVTEVSYTRTVSDAIGITDSVQTVQTFDRSITDSAGITDSVTTILGKTETVNDSLGVVDSVIPAISHGRQIDDQLGIADSITPEVSYTRSITDLMGIQDNVSSALSAARTVSDSIGISDTVSTVLGKTETFTDSIGVVDSTTTSMSLARPIADDIGITDDISYVLVSSQTISDTIGLTDSISHLLYSGSLVTGSAVIAAGVTVAPSGLVLPVRTFTVRARPDYTDTDERFWRYLNWGATRTLVWDGVGYQLLQGITAEEFESFSEVYQGGRSYRVSPEISNKLAEHGYGMWLEPPI